jgi:uncharacterized membrane protein (UPF0127 family)
VIATIAVLAAAVFVGRGGSRPRDPKLVNSSGAAATGAVGTRGIVGFGETGVAVTNASGTRQFCAALASTDAQQARGLMGRTDLGGYDAMVFQFPQARTGMFYMRNTPTPLSIAWFDDAGKFVSATDMEPCPDRPGCPEYAAAGPYRVAVEVPRGGLSALGIGSGSTIAVGGSCR